MSFLNDFLFSPVNYLHNYFHGCVAKNKTYILMVQSYHKYRWNGVYHYENMFKWKHYQSKTMILCVRLCLKYRRSYWNLQEMMEEQRLFIKQQYIDGHLSYTKNRSWSQ